jgi:type VI secretion system protein ImpH
MAPPQRQPETLLARLERTGPRFGFFQAVQLIHRLMPGAVRVGELGPPQAEAIRFLHDPSLVFHSSDIASIRVVPQPDGPARIDVTTTFLGLIGPSSPLATVFSEDVLNAEFRDQPSLRSFYDLFHHRLISLFFRSWHRARFSAAFQPEGTDPFTRRMLAFVGVDLEGAAPQRGLGPLDLLALAPLLVAGGRTARTLQIALERVVKGSVRIDQFVARTVQIGQDQRCLLGVQNCTLDADFAIGSTVTDCSGRFRVVVGPVDYATFESFMPGGREHARLRDVIMQLSPGHLEPELEIFVGAAHTPRFQLGREAGSQLGVSTHLTSGEQKSMRARVTLSEDIHEATARFVAEDRVA